jgi:prepilin-type N-terminal cleavage/methylation domain-containing protein
MKDNKSTKLNNKGVSLIEVIVVVIIIGIMATAVIVNIGQVYGRNAMNAATKLSKVLDAARLESMNKADKNVSVRLKVGSNDITATIIYKAGGTETEGETTVLGNTGLTVKIMQFAAGSDEIETEYRTLTGAVSQMDFSFKKSTGGFRTTVETDPKLAGVVFEGMKKAEVVLIWETGRNYVEALD